MAVRVLLYGPPATGKSTLIEYAAQTLPDCIAIDLEDVRCNRRFRFANRIDWGLVKGNVLLGAADLSPDEFPDGFVVARLVTEDVDGYRSRVERRAKECPEKQGQKELVHLTNIRDVDLSRFVHFNVDPLRFDGDVAGMLSEIMKNAMAAISMADAARNL